MTFVFEHGPQGKRHFAVLRIRSSDALPIVAPTLQPGLPISHNIFAAIDTEIRANDPATPHTNEVSIGVDLSSGSAFTQGL